MNPRDPSEASGAHFDELDRKILQALKEEGVIIPETIEDVRRAKARLKSRPVTVPPHLRDPAAIFSKSAADESLTANAFTPVAAISVQQNRSCAPVRHKTGSIYYRRAAFDAYVVHALTGDENLGRTKIEKITHLTEYHCDIDFEREPLRDAAGPVDYSSRRKVESLAKKQGWYSTVAAEGRWGVRYVPGPKLLDALPVAERTMGIHRPAVDALIELMRPLNTRSCEIIATLYAAWNDLLLRGSAPTDDAIVKEATESWHPKKLTIPSQQWNRTLSWMRNHRLLPKGTGKPVRHLGRSGTGN